MNISCSRLGKVYWIWENWRYRIFRKLGGKLSLRLWLWIGTIKLCDFCRRKNTLDRCLELLSGRDWQRHMYFEPLDSFFLSIFRKMNRKIQVLNRSSFQMLFRIKESRTKFHFTIFIHWFESNNLNPKLSKEVKLSKLSLTGELAFLALAFFATCWFYLPHF